MYGIMDSIQILLLSHSSQLLLAIASAELSIYTHGQVLFSAVSENLTKELCELSCMLSLFPSVTLVSLCDFWIAFTVSYTRHC